MPPVPPAPGLPRPCSRGCAMRSRAPRLRCLPAPAPPHLPPHHRPPITRADERPVRGVQSGDALRQLMERGLVLIPGRDDSLGRPVLHGTTNKFLQTFGLKSLRDLPAPEGVAQAKAAKKDDEE